MRHLTPSQIRFREFMRKLTGSPGLMNWRFYAYSWQVHGVFITLEKGSTTVRVYHFPTGAAKDCTAGDHGAVAYFDCDSERCREHIANLYFRHA